MALVPAALDDFSAVLDESELNYRIAFTTTDNANPLCVGTSPEGGGFVASSCLSRLDDFVFNGTEVLDYSHVCQDACSTPGLQTTDDRPWIEVTPEGTNLPAGVDVAEALRCFGPQGVNGCGMESPLASAMRSTVRAADDTQDEFGFFRDESIAAIVFLTDEVDCSYNGDWESIFDRDGDRTFWSDPVNLSTAEMAIPPVRLREFIAAFADPDERNLYSICADDYAPALRAIAQTIRQRARG